MPGLCREGKLSLSPGLACVSPVASDALIPLLRIPMSGPGTRGVGQWEPKQNKGANGEEEGWERGSQVSIPGEADVRISNDPRALSRQQ